MIKVSGKERFIGQVIIFAFPTGDKNNSQYVNSFLTGVLRLIDPAAGDTIIFSLANIFMTMNDVYEESDAAIHHSNNEAEQIDTIYVS